MLPGRRVAVAVGREWGGHGQVRGFGAQAICRSRQDMDPGVGGMQRAKRQWTRRHCSVTQLAATSCRQVGAEPLSTLSKDVSRFSSTHGADQSHSRVDPPVRFSSILKSFLVKDKRQNLVRILSTPSRPLYLDAHAERHKSATGPTPFASAPAATAHLNDCRLIHLLAGVLPIKVRVSLLHC